MALLKSYRKAPAIAAGAFSLLFAAPSQIAAKDLAAELLNEGRFAEARMEAKRAARLDKDNHAAVLLSLKAGVRLGKDHLKDLIIFAEDESVKQELRCEADYEAAMILETRNAHSAALKHLVSCFNKTSSSKLFNLATRKANSILNANPELEKSNTELINIIRTSAAAWPRRRRNERNSGSSSPAFLSRPALWAIALYRSQISPAIGARCSLEPSCSQYAVSALKQHGFIGLALAGDRMVREPDVIAAKEKPVITSRQVKYADPVHDHTFWMKENKK